MLFNHNDKAGPENVIGKWDNVRVENGKLVADAIFDEEEELALKVMKKVDNGFIKGTSVWVDGEKKNISLNADGIPVFEVSELMEASIVPVPNNKNSLKLCADGQILSDNTLAVQLSAGQNNPTTENQTNMKKILLFAQILGVTLSADATEDHLLEAVKTVAGERDELKKDIAKLTEKLNAEQDNKVNSLIDGAITSKKLSADKKDHFSKLAKLDFESTKAIIDGMTPQKTISEQLNAGGGSTEVEKTPFDGKGLKDLMKTSDGSKYLAKLRSGSTEEKALYKKLWEAAHPGGVFNG